MSVHLFQVTFEAATEIPRDRIVNTWHFEGSGSDPENVAAMLTDFYDSVIGGGIGTVSGLMTDQALEGTYWIKGYDLSDAEPRAPIYEDERLLANMDNTAPLPTEVALVMSYHATFASGVPAGRRRGRVYLGGLKASINSGGRPNTTALDTVAAAARELIQASNTSVSWDWIQYSPTTGTGNLVAGGWVDNAWDTQRRRGLSATSRTSFSGSTP